MYAVCLKQLLKLQSILEKIKKDNNQNFKARNQ